MFSWIFLVWGLLALVLMKTTRFGWFNPFSYELGLGNSLAMSILWILAFGAMFIATPFLAPYAVFLVFVRIFK